MDTQHLERLRIEQQNYQLVCQDKLAKWEKFKQDYLSLKSRLETLPDELKYDIMVPVCKNAFMPGRLVNTNEILVLLGENWFVERSTKQAREMIDRRLVSINKYIEEVSNEVKLYQDQMKWTDNLMKERGEFVNIEEKIDESAPKQPQSRAKLSDQEIKELRRKQQERALRTQEAVSKELKKMEEKSLAKIEEETVTQVQQLAVEPIPTKPSSLIEQLAEQFKVMDIEETASERIFSQESEYLSKTDEAELKNLMSEYDKQVDRENNKKMAKILNANAKSIKGSEEKKHVKWSDPESKSEYIDIDDDDHDDDYDDYDDDEDYYEEDEATSEPADEEEASKQPAVIRIKHTSNKTLEEIDRRNRLSRDKPELNSPGDIYNVFYKPKSILKQSSKENIPVVSHQDQDSKKTISKESPKNAENQKFEPEKAFSGEIVERKVLTSSKADTSNSEVDSQTAKKPISRFRASKK